MSKAKWIVPIMGFRESTAQPTGLEYIWQALRPNLDASTYMVTPYEWDEDMRGLVDFIQRNSPNGSEAMVIAYSWGCGVGFTTFAREALRSGLRIKIAVLCDPVYRSRIFPTWLPFNPLSISRLIRMPISIPASVERVEWVRQIVDYPRGHDLIAEDRTRTKIGGGSYVLARHRSIDNSEDFYRLAIREAIAFIHAGTTAPDHLASAGDVF